MEQMMSPKDAAQVIEELGRVSSETMFWYLFDATPLEKYFARQWHQSTIRRFFRRIMIRREYRQLRKIAVEKLFTARDAEA